MICTRSKADVTCPYLLDSLAFGMTSLPIVRVTQICVEYVASNQRGHPAYVELGGGRSDQHGETFHCLSSAFGDIGYSAAGISG